MPYEKRITVYESIPIDKIKGLVSDTELEICEVINDFIKEVREKSQDENFHLLSWDQVLMSSEQYYSSSVLEIILGRIESKLHGLDSPSNGTEVWEREYERREILNCDGYIFGDPLLEPYCPEGLISWVYAESKVIWLQSLISEYPKVADKAKFKKLVDREVAKRDKLFEILDGDPKVNAAKDRRIQVYAIIMRVIEGYGFECKNFRPSKWLTTMDGEKKMVSKDQFHQDCLRISPKHVVPVGLDGFEGFWKQFSKEIKNN